MKISWWILLVLVLFYSIFLFHPINLVTADLGRHLRNGESLLLDSSVLRANFYSYIYPDFPVLNHHWGAGLIFYLVWLGVGFEGLQIFFVIGSVVAFLLTFLIAWRKVGIGVSAILAIPAIMLLAERTEIRPEVFSYLFFAIVFWLLIRFREGRLSRVKLFLILPALQILWVNLHIYFGLGLVIIGAFLLEALLTKSLVRKPLFLVLIFCAAVTLLNPFGWRGALAPLELFQNFGYRLAENQTVWFLKNFFWEPNFLVFQVMLAVFLISVVWSLLKKTDWKQFLAENLMALLASAMAVWAVRNFALFALALLPALASNIRKIFPAGEFGKRWKKIGLVTAVLTLLVFVHVNLFRFFPYWRSFGWGIERVNSGGAEFFLSNKLKGPIFNNYDIGGYLIFYLFPEERVFVDNRPEAYPAEFFKNILIPMQEQDAVWQQELEKRKFNAIIFSRLDLTPWGQKFLAARVQDSAWALVFADERVLILLKRNEQNRAIIEKFEKLN